MYFLPSVTRFRLSALSLVGSYSSSGSIFCCLYRHLELLIVYTLCFPQNPFVRSEAVVKPAVL